VPPKPLPPDVLCCCRLLLGCVLFPPVPGRVQQQAPSHDVVLSSGFLAFAQHAGFLQAVEEVRQALLQQCDGSTCKAGRYPTCAAFRCCSCCPAVLTQAGVTVEGIMGTSAGALTGSLYAAGYTPKEVSWS
jgi:hypothetical protein